MTAHMKSRCNSGGGNYELIDELRRGDVSNDGEEIKKRISLCSAVWYAAVCRCDRLWRWGVGGVDSGFRNKDSGELTGIKQF